MGGEEYKNDKPLWMLFTTIGNEALLQTPWYNSVSRREGAVRKAEHRRNTNILSSINPMQKYAFEGTFEHRMNRNVDKKNTLHIRQGGK